MPRSKKTPQQTHTPAAKEPVSIPKKISKNHNHRKKTGTVQDRVQTGKTAKPAAGTSARLLPRPVRMWYKPSTWSMALPKPDYLPLPRAGKLLRTSLRVLWPARRTVGCIVGIYVLATLMFVGGMVAVQDITDYRQSLGGSYKGVGGNLELGLMQFSFLLGGGNQTNLNGNGGVYQTVLLVLCSLAMIYVLRELHMARSPGLKESFYNSTGPLIPFLGVSFMLFLQLLPLSIAAFLYTVGITNGFAVHWWEQGLVVCVTAALAFWSMRLIIGGIFALYVVTLPDMTPFRALKTARKLVYKRRLLIARKLLFLVVLLLAAAAVVEVPVLLYATALAPWLLLIIGAVSFVVIHSYMYGLYRELL